MSKLSEPPITEWNYWDESSGEMSFRSLSPEDILPDLVDGMGTYDLMVKYETTQEVIENVIMQIPLLVVWRDQQKDESPNGGMRLPR